MSMQIITQKHPNQIHDYIEAKLKIFPLHKIINGQCSCENPHCEAAGKHPSTNNWQSTPHWEEIQIETMIFSGQLKTGFGVLCKGLLVVDIDPRNGGDDSLKRLETDLGYSLMSNSCFVVSTGGGGWHYYFQYEGDPLAGKLSAYPGIDFKSSGFVVGAGSLHKSGLIYEYEKGFPQDIEKLPEELQALLKVDHSVNSQGGKFAEIPVDDLKSMLDFITCFDEYHDWVNIGMALHDATNGSAIGFDLWDKWSQRSDNYDDRLMFKKWNSFGKGGVTVATLIRASQEGGYAQPVTFYDPLMVPYQADEFVYDGDDEKENNENKTHPLAQFSAYSLSELTPPEFVLDDVIQSGLTLIAGAPGVGKTTQLLPLFLRVTGLIKGGYKAPSVKRKLIYIAEDIEQARRIIYSMTTSYELDDEQSLNDRFLLVESKRLKPKVIAQVADLYKTATFDNKCADGTIYKAQPLVVFDTAASTIDLENENDNAEVSKAIAVLKQDFKGMAVCVVAHTSKALKRANGEEIANVSARGASAWEGDVNQVAYLCKEDDGTRWLEIAHCKHRFATHVAGVAFTSHRTERVCDNVIGHSVYLPLVHGIPELVSDQDKVERKELAEAAKEAKKLAVIEQAKQERKQAILSALQDAIDEGVVISRDRAIMGGKKTLKIEALNEMLEDGVVFEYLLDDEERKAASIHNRTKGIYWPNPSGLSERELIKKIGKFLLDLVKK